MTPESFMIPSTDDVVVALHHWGGTGPPVLFCHATGFHARVWDPIVEQLIDDHDCWGVDMRGHGDSLLPEGTPLVWTGMAADVIAAVEEIRRHRGDPGEPMLAVGHSMGGAAIVMAELWRPGTFARAFLYEPILFPPITENMERRNAMAEGARRRRADFDSLDAAYERYASRPPLDSFDPKALRAYVDHGFRPTDTGVTIKCLGSTEAEVFDNSDNRAWLHLGEVETVIEVAAGADDGGPATIAAQVAERLPHGSCHIDRSMSHFGPMEAPEEFAALIRGHLDARSDSAEETASGG